jgi:hypothetical protein
MLSTMLCRVSVIATIPPAPAIHDTRQGALCAGPGVAQRRRVAVQLLTLRWFCANTFAESGPSPRLRGAVQARLRCLEVSMQARHMRMRMPSKCDATKQDCGHVP